jgi:hypothetical protein
MKTLNIDDSFSNYPFLKKVREQLRNTDASIERMFSPEVKDAAVDRVEGAIKNGAAMGNRTIRSGEVEWQPVSDSETRLLSYPLCRILVSILNEPEVTQAYIEGEAETAISNFKTDIPKQDTTSSGDDLLEPYSGDGRSIEFEDISDGLEIDAMKIDKKDILDSTAVKDVWGSLNGEARASVIKTQNSNVDVSSDVGANVVWEDIDQHTSIDFDDSRYFKISVPDYLRFSHELNVTLSELPVTDGYIVLDYNDFFEFLKCPIREAIVNDGLQFEVQTEIKSKLSSELGELISRLSDYLDQFELAEFPLLDIESVGQGHTVNISDTEKYSPVGKEPVEIPLSDIREHYNQSRGVYVELGSINGYHTSWLGAQEHAGWYVNGNIENQSDHPGAWENGFPRWNRPSILPDDFDANTTGRSVYTTNTYAAKECFKTRYYKTENGDRKWMDEELGNPEVSRLPDYDELDAYSLIVDIDLEDEWKARPLPESHQEVVESRLSAWVNAFSKFVGGDTEDVFVVDSGGGAYVMTPPMAVHSISERFSGDELHQIHNEIQTRMRELTKILDEVITSLDDAPVELFSADAVQNKNRQWKTLLSVHADLDAVVHPIDPEDIDYDELSFDDLTAAHRETATEWAERFTEQSYEKHVSSIVSVLFESNVFDMFDSHFSAFDGEDWEQTLENFLEHKEGQAEKNERLMEMIESDTEMGDVGVTTEKIEIDAAIAQVSLEDYLRSYHVQRWATDNRSDGTVSFSPKTWRSPSTDANSCFYAPSGGKDGSPIFVDRKDGWTAGIVDLIAFQEGITGHPSETPTGKDWWDAVDSLRQHGEDIPVQVPDITDEDYDYDSISERHIIKTAVALDIAEEDDIVVRDGKYGEYETLEKEQYNRTLKKLEELNIAHGKDPK